MTRKEYQAKYDEYVKKVERWKAKGYIFDEKTQQWCEPREMERRIKVRKYNEYIKNIRPIVLDRDDHKCIECGIEDNIHVHHIKPRKDGGEDTEGNLIALCNKCHAEKHKESPAYRALAKSN